MVSAIVGVAAGVGLAIVAYQGWTMARPMVCRYCCRMEQMPRKPVRKDVRAQDSW